LVGQAGTGTFSVPKRAKQKLRLLGVASNAPEFGDELGFFSGQSL